MLEEENRVSLIGKLVTPFELSHSTHDENFYKTEIKIPRTSGTEDIIPIVIPEETINLNKDYNGIDIQIVGQFRSYNEDNRLILFVFASEIFPIYIEEISESEMNQIYLNGYVCRKPTYRRTPGGREVCDILLAVNRSYNKSDYIPCIVWGRRARTAAKLDIGDNVHFNGRVQSREYIKENQIKIAYEVSVTNMWQD